MGLLGDLSVGGADSRVPGGVPVRLEAVGDDMMAVIRVVRAHTGLALADAHALVGRAPCVIGTLDGRGPADALVVALESVGASASAPHRVASDVFEVGLDGLRGRLEPLVVEPSAPGLPGWIGRAVAGLFGLMLGDRVASARPPVQRFEVRRGVLEVVEEHPGAAFGARGVRVEVALAGATVRVFDDGLWIRPALGAGVRLQGRGTRGTFERLAELLREEGRRTSNRGSSADVPDSLTGMTGPDESAG